MTWGEVEPDKRCVTDPFTHFKQFRSWMLPTCPDSRVCRADLNITWRRRPETLRQAQKLWQKPGVAPDGMKILAEERGAQGRAAIWRICGAVGDLRVPEVAARALWRGGWFILHSPVSCKHPLKTLGSMWRQNPSTASLSPNLAKLGRGQDSGV